MKIKIFQKGFNYSQDGVGNRLVYHLQGCNMHCPWCANPESMSHSGTLMVNNEWLVDSVCPYGAISQKHLERSMCKTCSTRDCILANKNRGVRCSCEEYEIETIIDEVKRSAMLFFDGGGVTISGGEPTQQFDAVNTLLTQLKKNDIHTAIETNATHPRLAELFPLIDLLMMDFKHYDNDVHLRVTGVGNHIIKENVAKALELHKNVLIRIPLIRGFNASEGDIMNFVAFFKTMETQHVSFEFLPYHEYGKAKWMQCGMAYKMSDAFVEDKILVMFEKAFKAGVLSVVRT